MKNLDLLEIRKQLDEVDAQMVRLFEERMALSMDVAKSKLASGKAVYDGQREKEKLAALEKMTEGDFNRQAVRELFTQLMTIGRKRQYQYLAEHGKALDLGFCPVDSLKKEGGGGRLQPRGGHPVFRSGYAYVSRSQLGGRHGGGGAGKSRLRGTSH